MKARARLSLFALWLVASPAISNAQQQIPNNYPVLQPHQSATSIVRNALEIPYAKSILNEFAGSVTKLAPAGCLRTNKLDEEKIIAGGREIFALYGTRLLERIAALVDKTKFEKALAELGGDKANKELLDLPNDETVRHYAQARRREESGTVLDFLAEHLDRYLNFKNIGWTRFAVTWTGKTHLVLQQPRIEAEQTIQQILAAKRPPQLARYLELEDHAKKALVKALDFDKFWSLRAATFFEGVEKDLAALCIAVPG
jgi:hypothetical protein